MHTTRTFIPARLVLAGFLASTGLFAVAQTDAGAADGATVDQTITCDADSMTITTAVTREPDVAVSISADYTGSSGGYNVQPLTHTDVRTVPIDTTLRVAVHVNGETVVDSGFRHRSADECGLHTPPIGTGYDLTLDPVCTGSGVDYGVVVTAEDAITVTWQLPEHVETDATTVSGVERFSRTIAAGDRFDVATRDRFGRELLYTPTLVARLTEPCASEVQHTAQVDLLVTCSSGDLVAHAWGTNTGDDPADLELVLLVDGEGDPTSGAALPGEEIEASAAAHDGATVIATLTATFSEGVGGGREGTEATVEETSLEVDRAALCDTGSAGPGPVDGVDAGGPGGKVPTAGGSESGATPTGATPTGSTQASDQASAGVLRPAGDRRTLPVTGLGSLATAVAGAALVGSGTVLTRVGRRRDGTG